jgi:hypothetical protein
VVLAVALRIGFPGVVAVGGAGMRQLERQFAACALQDIKQFVTVEVTGVEGAGDGVTVGGFVTACARASCAPEQIIAAATRITKLRIKPPFSPETQTS